MKTQKQTNKSKRQLTEAARCAKDIRKELKENFKKTKFSVRSSNFSMGDSVNIDWTDGPTMEEVEKITKKYQYGHFDGMIDMYEYSNNRDDIPQAKYISATRHMSEETKKGIIKKHNSEFCEEGQIQEDGEGWNEDARCWNSSVIYREFSKLNLEGY